MKLPIQLVKGGKHTFGWSAVTGSGRIAIPAEAIAEYGLEEGDRLVVVPGSRTSGGFGLSSRESLSGSILAVVLEEHPELGQFSLPAGDVVEHDGRPYCWVPFHSGAIDLAAPTLAKYGIKIGERLLVIRGSGLALGFAVRGPIVHEARKHRELPVFEFKE
jgi:bifunctional DNA-binding transcriptional regulator/antitoxin component of YhaV-PrlF toxin-antitoxin module